MFNREEIHQMFILMFEGPGINTGKDWIRTDDWKEKLILNGKVIEDLYWVDQGSVNPVYYDEDREPYNFDEDVKTIEPTKDIFKYIFGDWAKL